MSIKSKDSTPPPTVGKIGPYTIFATPPPTPSASAAGHLYQSPPEKVQPLPQQFHKPVAAPSEDSAFGFFRNAVAKVQRAHSSLDEYMAHWFGLNQSKYQWALDDYYESKEMDQVDSKTKDVSSKIQSVYGKQGICRSPAEMASGSFDPV